MSDIETRFGSLHLEDAVVTRVVTAKSPSTSADRVEIELRALTEKGWWPMNLSFLDPVMCTIEWSITDWSSVSDDISDYSCERIIPTESLGETIIRGQDGEDWYRFNLDVFGRMRRISIVARDFSVTMDESEAKTE